MHSSIIGTWNVWRPMTGTTEKQEFFERPPLEATFSGGELDV